jgi:hypothetical protein
MSMATFTEEIAAYRSMEADLLFASLGKWVLIRDRALIGTFDTFQDAARLGMEKFGRTPYLIKQIGAGPVSLPPLLYR